METPIITKSKFSVGFFFLCLGVLITLITSVVSFLNLVFGTLNKRFPDVLNSNYQYGYSTYDYEGIRMALATILVFFPIFMVISYFWRKFARKGLSFVNDTFKNWLVYVILFLSSLVVIIDLVTLISYFISGEITYRFVLKVVTVLLVALLVGLYYISVLKNGENKTKKEIVFAVLGSIFVLVAVVYSFMIIGSPMKQRAFRLDDRRVGDLQNIQYQVINYWQQKEKLPKDLPELANPLTGYSIPVEPEFEKGRVYEYSVKGPLTFELCATFSEQMPKGWREWNTGGIMPMVVYDKAVSSVAYPYPGSGVNESWDHEEGRTCFERTIDKDIYPPFSKSFR